MNTDKAIDLLHDDGHKLTSRRKDMLTFLANADGYRTAKDLHVYMETKYDGISFDTVYRNLHLFHDLKILESTELNGERHFRMNCSQDHHHHFICNDCGKTKKINVCPMDELDNSFASYDIQDHKFEVYGLCPLCRSA